MKRWKKIVFTLAAIFFFLILATTIVLNSAHIQTHIANTILSHLSPSQPSPTHPSPLTHSPTHPSPTHPSPLTPLCCQSLRYRFPLRLELRGVKVLDEQSDTLLYVGSLYARVSPLALLRHRICIRSLEIDTLHIHAYHLTDSTYNFTYLLNLFAPKDTTAADPSTLNLSCSHLALTQAHIQYDSILLHIPNLEAQAPTITSTNSELSLNDLTASCTFVNRSEHFDIVHARATMMMDSATVAIPRLHIELPHSLINLTGGLTGDLAQPYRYQPQLDIYDCQIALRDLALFAPPLASLHDYVDFHAHLGGRLDSLSLNRFTLHLDGEPVFRGEASLIGLPQWRRMVVDAVCTDLYVPTHTLESMIANIQRHPYVFPDEVQRLGSIHYRGRANGRAGNIDLQGALTTDIGSLTLEGQCQMDSAFRHIQTQATISSSRIDLGTWLASEDLGAIALHLTANLERSTDDPLHGTVAMRVEEFTYKNYPYHDITLDGSFRDVSGSLTTAIHDPNLDLTLTSTFDLTPLVHATASQSNESGSPATIALTSRLTTCRPANLHLTKRFLDSEMATVIRVSEQFRDWDHIEGFISMDSTYLRQGESEAWIGHQQLTTSVTDAYNRIALDGDLMQGELSGRFLLSQMKEVVSSQIARYLPSFFPETSHYSPITKGAVSSHHAPLTAPRWQLSLTLTNLQPLQTVLQLPFHLSDNIRINSFFTEAEDQWLFDLSLPAFQLGQKAHLKDLVLHSDNDSTRANIRLTWEQDHAQLGVYMRAWSDTIAFNMLMRALPPYTSTGAIRTITHLSHYASQPFVDTHIYPSVVQLGDSVYHIGESTITYNAHDTILQVSDFLVQGHHQSIAVNGIASHSVNDTLAIGLEDINIGLIMPYLLPKQTLTASGRVSGWANLYSLFDKPIFDASVKVDSTLFNESYFGTVKADVALEPKTSAILIGGDVHRFGRLAAVVKGKAEPKKGRFQIDITPDSLPLNFIEHWTHNFLRDITGTVSGTVSVRGEGKKTYVITRAKTHHVGLTVPFTGCTYYVNDSVFMDSTSITFPRLTLLDAENHPFSFHGDLTHDAYFRNFRLNLHATPTGILALTLPATSNSAFTGKVYARGQVDITGPDNDIQLNATAVATGNSAFRLALGGASSARDNSFITFVQRRPQNRPRDTVTFIPTIKKPRFLRNGASRFRMGMSIDIDPQTLFQLVLDQRTGDMIEARGDGSVKLVMDDATDALNLVGTYTVSSGKMGFTIGNVIRRDFTLDAGSTIIWNGYADKPVLDVTARYQVTASLKDLFGSETENIISGRTSVPVNTLIHLTGSLNDPIIQFSIELPKSEDNIENQVRAVINTDEMMMRQVVYLLVFGKFFTPEYMKANTANNTALNDTYALLSSTITGQINNWLGKLTNVFTMGFNVRQEGTEQSAAREYEAVFQLQPIERIIINGNFGYRYNDVSNQPFFGDLDIECLLTPNGKYRLKGYTHTVDKYSLKQASTTQGVGFLFRHDFNWVNPNKTKRTPKSQQFNTSTHPKDTTTIDSTYTNMPNMGISKP